MSIFQYEFIGLGSSLLLLEWIHLVGAGCDLSKSLTSSFSFILYAVHHNSNGAMDKSCEKKI